jgi:2-oxo-4-hydroxy-4-carboxy-5-ureidoimidazoline decarboxylase
MKLSALNQGTLADFVAALGTIFEHSPWVAEEAWPAAPFRSVDELHAAMIGAVVGSPRERQIALICAHPDLADKAASSGGLSPSSAAEQGAVGLLSLSDAELELFRTLNATYRQHFGFPFVIAVSGHDKTSLLAAFEARLQHPREEEIDTALSEIYAITRLRLDALVEAD